MTPNETENITEIIDRRRPRGSWVKPVAWAVVGVTLIVCVYRLALHFTPRELAGAVSAPLEKGVALTGKFLQYTGNFLTTANTSTHTEVEVGRITSANKSGPLIVAKQDVVLRFTTIDERIFGTSTAEVKSMAKAFYYVPLLGPGAEWRIDTVEKDGVRVCIVYAPAMRLLTPVNVDTRNLEIRTTTGVLRSNGQEMSEGALAEVTPRLNKEAQDQMPNVRDAARKTIARFVKSWLATSNQWGGQKLNAIQVVFPGEKPVDADFEIPGFHERP